MWPWWPVWVRQFYKTKRIIRWSDLCSHAVLEMRKWVLLLTCRYCFKWQANTVKPSFYLVLDILHMLKNGRVGHSGLNTAGSFLSSFVTIEDYVAGKHTHVCKYVKVSYKKINSFQNIDLLGCGLSYKLS